MDKDTAKARLQAAPGDRFAGQLYASKPGTPHTFTTQDVQNAVVEHLIAIDAPDLAGRIVVEQDPADPSRILIRELPSVLTVTQIG